MPEGGLLEQKGQVRAFLTTSLCMLGVGGVLLLSPSSLLAQEQKTIFADDMSLTAQMSESETSTSEPLVIAAPGATEASQLPDIPSLPGEGSINDFAISTNDGLSSSAILGLATFGGLLIFTLIAGWSSIRARRQANMQLREAHQAIVTLQSRLDQSESLLDASDQMMIIWDNSGDAPNLIGSLTSNHQLPNGDAILAFGSWLNSDCAQQLEQAIETLRSNGQRFQLIVEARMGAYVEIKGRTSGARAHLQLRVLEDEERDRAHLRHKANRLSQEMKRMKSLLDAVPMPVWSRDEKGELSWINEAYRLAVDAENLRDVLEKQTELLDQQGRDLVRKAHVARAEQSINDDKRSIDVAVERLPVIMQGKRQILDVVDIASTQGNVGIATDVSAIDHAERALERMQTFHATTMDQLTTAVAIFDSNQTLQFYNAAYHSLFDLDPAFLDQQPTDGAILDRLRADRQLPEQADFAVWKSEMFSAYRSVDTQEHWWHLPNGQSLRVVAAPNPDGGVTYIYENITERLDLEKRYNSLIRVQSETLDHLGDGVIVFGSDGRVRVSNPAFASMWSMDEGLLAEQPHVSAVLEVCRRTYSDPAVWADLKQAIVGLADSREGLSGRMDREDERVVDYALVPLPDGASMITFVDVTDKVNVERGLTTRNEALMAADHLKNTFIQHVSYELRSPLTNIIGFTELLTEETFGSLNEKQREYTDHIMTSSSSLLAIVNDILDLATIDAGIMVLELEEVDPVGSIQAAAEGLQDRLAEKDITLNVSVADNLQNFMGDSKRVRQVLYNMISNAIAFSPDHSNVSVLADQTASEMVFTVRDHGCGMPEEFLSSAFERFESRKAGETRKGAGLGLSIVKSFVELHGGHVSIDSVVGKGTAVICHFPIAPQPVSQAAE
ncbi:PAS-domain containing protein [Cohaesibacter gelatinilyticus]|uniref:histidine kinase n=1 Tax=Cohaesibacter gelatinilyticus TaxID=372072 RepID=A0A285PLA9_9HYPH|nr:PAS-domain containing protein [Cohaesibacter gelatinilyticus]SNZ20651.1 PAS fold [Cohaesibacter gelatinilyticus]